jgi:hypothetical protein
MTLFIPNMLSALVDKAGKILPPWNSFFQQFSNPPAPIMSVIVGTDPFSYVVKQPGMVVLVGGTTVSLTRGKTTISMGTAKSFPVEIADIVVLGGSPTLKFVPRY